ncbi:hypothetical protein EV356DRAFT_498853 [Viridothelium virens]|uniref:DUF7624 domain-containing protein n=1 Tax=Viridothelium virens TaxID=1048519 RepID=A0A6A6HEU6_VIRVR|nr:hypothetical protein EV356DRAFT_498853 [Viridothelium virens]
MALKSPLMPSPTGPAFMSHFSPYSDSPSSPAPYNAHFQQGPSRNSNPSDSLHPPVSPYPNHVDPSPVESNGSANTDIDEDAQEGTDAADPKKQESKDEPASVEEQALSPTSLEALGKLDTALSPEARAEPEDGPTSVIHIPSGFKKFESKKSTPPDERAGQTEHSPTRSERTDRTGRTDDTVLAVPTGEEHATRDEKRGSVTSPLNTSIPNSNDLDQGTPQAQTRQELEDEWRRRSRAPPNLEGIQEEHDGDKHDDEIHTASVTTDQDTMTRAIENLNNAEQEIAALKTALSECWTLCNTLAGLSNMHRERMFQFEGKGGAQEQAWRSCWQLCQNLYKTREEDHVTQVRPTLELCRDFCQALFEVRTRGDDVADSVLRVSFELNNHLYNTQDRNLPEAFRERTLDFYLTLCHRLMKQRTNLPQETDSLLRACWSLAEMLFSIRQNNRDGKPADEELLGSAVQACWDLCDLFREGWTQIRPERGTPKPIYSVNAAAAIAPSANTQPFIHSEDRSSSLGDRGYPGIRNYPPETPITIFDDTTAASSPAEDAPVPNILVLGPEHTTNHTRASTIHHRWDSSASAYSDASSTHTGSTATTGRDGPRPASTTPSSNDSTLIRLKCLILKAAINVGFSRPNPSSAASTSSTSSSSKDNAQLSLPSFVSELPPNAFGALPWQHALLKQYQALVTSDPTLRDTRDLPTGKRVSAGELARAVKAMVRTGQFEWLRGLYRLVFGFGIDEVGGRAGVVVAT